MRQYVKVLLMVCAVCCNGSYLNAQVGSLKALSRSFEWGAIPELDKHIHPLAAPEGADILWEKQRVSFIRSKPEFLTTVFEKHFVMRFGTREAAREHSQFVLPESFDPISDYQDVAWEDRDSLPRPIYFQTRLERFAARVIGPQEEQRELEVQGKVITQRKKTGDRFFRAYSYDLVVNGILPGDTVEVYYKYTVPFEFNWYKFNSSKHFFHGDLYKHRYELKIDATLTQGFNLRGAPADSVGIIKNKRSAYWWLTDLPPVMHEVNARPHEDLPHVVYGTAVNSKLYQHGHVISSSLGGRPYMYSDVPYWVTVLRQREFRAPAYRRVALKKFGIDAQSKQVRSWSAQFGGEEKHPIEKALQAHNRIARDFTFKWDDAWYDHEDKGLLKPGDMLYEEQLREIGRYDQYSKLLSELQINYNTVYVQDKRAGRISPEELTNLWENEFLFVLKHEEQDFLLHPKRARGGYFVNEKPFYWEGTVGLIGDLDKLYSNYPKNPELYMLPSIIPSANSRYTAVSASIGLSGSMQVEATVLLKGQFSTTTRNAYLHNDRDSTLMPVYGKRYLNGSEIKRIDGPTGLAPYTTEVEMIAELQGRIKKQGTAEFIDLSGMFPFLTPTGYEAQTRDLAFYWDFVQNDRFNITLNFDEPVVIEERIVQYGSEELGAELHIGPTQNNDRTVSVSAVLWVTKERVAVGRSRELEELLDACHDLNSMAIPISKPY